MKSMTIETKVEKRKGMPSEESRKKLDALLTDPSVRKSIADVLISPSYDGPARIKYMLHESHGQISRYALEYRFRNRPEVIVFVSSNRPETTTEEMQRLYTSNAFRDEN